MPSQLFTAPQGRIECELHPYQLLRLQGAQGRRIDCLRGVVWITVEGMDADIFLRAGHAYLIPSNCLVLAEAIGDCRIRVDAPRAVERSPHRAAWIDQAASWSKLLRGRRHPAL